MPIAGSLTLAAPPLLSFPERPRPQQHCLRRRLRTLLWPYGLLWTTHYCTTIAHRVTAFSKQDFLVRLRGSLTHVVVPQRAYASLRLGRPCLRARSHPCCPVVPTQTAALGSRLASVVDGSRAKQGGPARLRGRN